VKLTHEYADQEIHHEVTKDTKKSIHEEDGRRLHDQDAGAASPASEDRQMLRLGFALLRDLRAFVVDLLILKSLSLKGT